MLKIVPHCALHHSDTTGIGRSNYLVVEKRGTQIDLQFLGQQVQLIYDIPMAEVVLISLTP